MARTTLDLDDDILRRLRRRRTAEGRPMGAIASELLLRALDETNEATPDLVWTTAPMGAGIDLEDKDALWAALDAST